VLNSEKIYLLFEKLFRWSFSQLVKIGSLFLFFMAIPLPPVKVQS
jgi:hypothetical protein